MQKRRIFILFILFFFGGSLVFLYLKQRGAHQARLCEISEFFFHEEKLIKQSAKQESADEFFWSYYGKNELLKAEQGLELLRPTQAATICNANLENDFSNFFILNPADQEKYLSLQTNAAKVRFELYQGMKILKAKKEAAFLQLQIDLKKYHFLVRQLKSGDLPAHLLKNACRAPASLGNIKMQLSCKKALILTNEFRKKDESNLLINRQILFEKWVEFRDWVESAVSNIEEEDKDEFAHGDEK